MRIKSHMILKTWQSVRFTRHALTFLRPALAHVHARKASPFLPRGGPGMCPSADPSAKRHHRESVYIESPPAAGGQGQGPGSSRDSPGFQRKNDKNSAGNTMAAAENPGTWPRTLYFLAQRRGIVELKQINGSFGLELKRLLASLCF